MTMTTVSDRVLKSWVPRLPATWVSRPRLLRVLDAGSNLAVTTVIGPPGLGKTTLAAEWVQTCDRAVTVWLRLEAEDNDPERLCDALASACESSGLTFAAPHTDLRSLLTTLRASAMDQSVVLVLDDAHELTSRRSWDALLRVQEGVPVAPDGSHLHVVVITRSDPPLGLQRLRLQGQLLEIRAADLCFDVAETRELLARHGIAATDDDVNALREWSGGWIAALSLAVHAMADAPDDDVLAQRDDTEAHLADFILHEALVRMSADDRDFVLRAAVADTLTPELAVELTASSDAHLRLRRLARTGAFLLEAENHGDRFRFHPLMASLLRAQLRTQDPALSDELARVASTWYAEHGMYREAEVQSIRGGDWPSVARTRMARLRRALIAGRPNLDLLSDLPSSVPLHRPEFAPLVAMRSIARGERIAAIPQAEDLEASTTDATTTLLVRTALECAFGKPFGERCAADELVQRATTLEAADPAVTSHALIRRAEIHALDGDFGSARTLLRRVGVVDGSGTHRGDVAALRYLLDCLDGARRRSVDVVPTSEFGLEAAQLGSALAMMFVGDTARARATLTAGDTIGHRSSALLRSVRAAAIATLSAPSLHHPLELHERSNAAIRTLVALGHLHYIDADGSIAVAGGDAEATLARARRALLVGSPNDVVTLVRPVLTARRGAAHPRTCIEAAVLKAIAEVRQRRESDALASLERALALAEATGMRAPIQMWGEHLEALLERHLWELAGRHPYAVEIAEHLRVIHYEGASEQLTDREKAVLRHLQTMMSNAEIAGEMLVSVNTVKTHLKAIYRKLGVERRRDAVLCGRQRGLL